MQNISKLLKIFGCLLLIFCVNQKANAQNVSQQIGVKGGFNLSNLYVDEVDDQNARIGLHFGLFSKMPVTDNFALQPELLFNTKGSTNKFSGLIDGELSLNTNYIDLPILAVVDLSDYVSIHGGIYGSYLLSINATTMGDLGNNYTELEKDNFQTFDYGLAGGLQFNVAPLKFGIRYNYGLRGIGKEGWAKEFLGDAKNSVLQLSAGINF